MPDADLVSPIDLPEFRQGIHKIAKARRQALKNYVEQAEVLAEAAGDYERRKAIAFMRLKNSGSTVTEADATVRGQEEVVMAAIARDKEAALLKGRAEEIAGIDAERASLHRLAEWSMKAG